MTFIRPLQTQRVSKLETEVTFECEISRERCKVDWSHDDVSVYSDARHEVQVDGKVHRCVSYDAFIHPYTYCAGLLFLLICLLYV